MINKYLLYFFFDTFNVEDLWKFDSITKQLFWIFLFTIFYIYVENQKSSMKLEIVKRKRNLKIVLLILLTYFLPSKGDLSKLFSKINRFRITKNVYSHFS